VSPLRFRANGYKLVDRVTKLGWWTEFTRRSSGVIVTLTAGGALGQWIADKNFKFITDPALEGWFQLSILCVAIWIILTVSRDSWHPEADVSSKDDQMLLTQMAISARSLADARRKPLQAKKHFVRGTMATHVVNSLSRVYRKVDDVRTVVYELNAEKTLLSPLHHAGERAPAGAFSVDTPRGQAAIDFVLADNGPELVADVKKENRDGWGGSGNGYRTYISAPIVSESGYHGMLTIDAPHPGDLTQQDKRVVGLAASLLSAGFASIKK
jgi:hypothetical protein